MKNIYLSDVQKIQAAFDAENDSFEDAKSLEAKRRHTFLHLGKLLGKVASVEERAEHGDLETSVITLEVIGDLVVFAAQYAELMGVDLADAYYERLASVAVRNGNSIESAERAFSVVD